MESPFRGLIKLHLFIYLIHFHDRYVILFTIWHLPHSLIGSFHDTLPWRGHSGIPPWTAPSDPPSLWPVFCCRWWPRQKTSSLPFCSPPIVGHTKGLAKEHIWTKHTHARTHARIRHTNTADHGYHCDRGSPLCWAWPPLVWMRRP